MKIQEIITKKDLGEPYDRLLDFLELEDISKLEQLYNGQNKRFKRYCEDIKNEYPELYYALGKEKGTKVLMMLGDMNIYFPTLKHSTRDTIWTIVKKEDTIW